MNDRNRPSADSSDWLDFEAFLHFLVIFKKKSACKTSKMEQGPSVSASESLTGIVSVISL